MAFAHTEIPIVQQQFLIHPSMLYGASSETTPRNPQFLIPEAIRSSYKLHSVSWGYSLAPNVVTKHLKDGSKQAVDESRQLSKSMINVVRLLVVEFQKICY